MHTVVFFGGRYFMSENPKIALVIPCYNEEITIGKVIDDAKKYINNQSFFLYSFF